MWSSVKIALVLILHSSFAYAQSNDVSLGQVGDTNSIRVDQIGAGNLVGATPDRLRLNQIGDRNEVEIDQYGNFNTVGSLEITSDGRPTGLNQFGNRNRLVIDQSTGEASGMNMIGAIRQAAFGFDALSDALANSLDITQSGDGGHGGHVVGEIWQVSRAWLPGGDFALPPTRETNFITIEQTGGGPGRDEGHRLDAIFQTGEGNVVDVAQSASGNRIDTIRQFGAANTAQVSQQDGADNFAGELSQRGGGNGLDLRQSGRDNIVDRIVQANEGVAISGNRVSLTLTGTGNGGDGDGGGRIGVFSPALRDFRVPQASVIQIGDANDVSYHVGTDAGRAGDGSAGNLFGFFQDGSGNGAVGVVTGSFNEAASRQAGDDNSLDFLQSGIENRMGFSQNGEGNQAFVDQEGERNSIVARMVGNSNRTNAAGAPRAGSGRPLLPDGLVQRGFDNRIEIQIGSIGMAASDNLVAILQDGSFNFASATVHGIGNQASITQASSGNIAVVEQNGYRNTAIIRQ